MSTGVTQASKHRAPTRHLLPRPSQRAARAFGGSLLAAAGVAAALPAEAATITPTDPVVSGSTPVVRDDAITAKVDKVGLNFTRTTATANFAAQSPAAIALSASACKGDNPSGTNNSPRTTLQLVSPAGVVLDSAVSPVLDLSFAGVLGGAKPLATQPAPNNTNYRGDVAASPRGFSASFSLAGRPAGLYKVRTITQNMVKTGSGACTVGTPVAGTTTAFGNTFTAGVVTIDDAFEYRPWQTSFKDVFGKGSVKANLTPREFTFTVDGRTTPIRAAVNAQQTFYALPGAFALPSDPNVCLTDAASCVPPSAVPCDPSAGCTPRAMVIAAPIVNGAGLTGVFDLETKAFIAQATAGGTSRVLTSLGTAQDSAYGKLLTDLAASAGAQGIDLMKILQTQIRVDSNGQRTSLSLLNGLQIDPTTRPGGISIASDATVQAGIVLNINASLRIGGTSCKANSATSSDAVGRFTRAEPSGYTVRKSDYLPEVPRVGALGALVGGPVWSIQSVSPGADSTTLVNTSTSVIGVDTAVDEPHGYPVWINPFVSGGSTTKPRTMDFVGTGTWSSSETPIAGLGGCTKVHFLLGTGVAVYNNPLSVGLSTILDPLVQPSPQAQQLTDAVNAAVDTVVADVATTPAVESLLTTVTDALPLG